MLTARSGFLPKRPFMYAARSSRTSFTASSSSGPGRDAAAGPCEVDADESTPLEHFAPVHRDPVDAGRQLEVLAQLFRDGEMPRDGVDILEGVASRCTYEEIARDLEISTDTVEGRMRRMRDKLNTCMAKRRMLPGMLPMHVLVRTPAAIEMLRKTA